MTKVITRYFDTAAQARAVRDELLYRKWFPQNIIRLFDQAGGLAGALEEADVDAATAAEYERRVAAGGAVLMVRAGYKPLGVAQITRDETAKMGAIELSGMIEEVEVKDPIYSPGSVLTDHPLVLTRRKDPSSTTFHMADWPIPLISRREPFRESLFPRHARMANFPIPLISRRKPFTGSIFSRHARMANFPLPLLSQRKPFTGSIFPRHARMANFPIPLISRRKPYTGSLIARHARMANWPFPHLINGARGKNSLMPGAPRMANFPIRLISQRKPFTGSIFPRHARMANFPIPLLSKRKPYSESLFPRHARMASFPIPLLAKDMDTEGTELSLSKILGLPTILRR